MEGIPVLPGAPRGAVRVRVCARVGTCGHLCWSWGERVLSLKSEENWGQLVAALSEDADGVWARTAVIQLGHSLAHGGLRGGSHPGPPTLGGR